MKDLIYLAWRYLSYYKAKTSVLIAAAAVIVYLPVGLNIIVYQSKKELTARAEVTPLLVGAKGSPLELVLNSLYFESDTPEAMPFGQVTRIERSQFARAIPLYTRYRSGDSTIVGTSLDYFEFRGLQLGQGRWMAMLGECVLGYQAARIAGAGPGDSVLSTPESVFDIAGVYPLRMKVVGVLAPSGTPDDRAVFVDIKTTWVIEGLAHGHQDLRRADASNVVLRVEGTNVIGNAAVIQYNEISAENVESFHFHGDPADFPITSAIAIPFDDKANTLLQGRYLGPEETVQLVRPQAVMDTLLGTIFTVRNYVLVATIIAGVATLATMILVFVLSLQLRRREIETMIKIGGAKSRIIALLASEIIGVAAAGVLLSASLSLLTFWSATAVTRMLIQMS